METYSGKSIYNGSVMGKVYFYSMDHQQIECRNVTNIQAEIKRYETARSITIGQFQELYKKAVSEVGEEQAILFKAYAMILEGEDYSNSVYKMIKNNGTNAEYAVLKTGDYFAGIFSGMDDEYFKIRSVDIKDITEHLLMVLTGTTQSISIGNEPVIVAADDMTPSEMLQMDKTNLLGLVIEHGSVHSHTVMLAKTMNIPTLIGVQVQKLWDGKMAIVDGKEGKLIVEPDPETIEFYSAQQKKEEEIKELLIQLKGLPDVTPDGHEMKLYANVGSVADVTDVLSNDAAGIGLFRSECLYMEKEEHPTEEEQFRIYSSVAKNMAGKKVVIRTFDIGADKQVNYFNLEQEKNPAMGYRGIRICLDRKDIFKIQLRALYRAAVYGNISILFPMIVSVKEVQDIKAVCAEVKAELDAGGINYGDVELGIMIETPAAVIISDMLAKEVDFFSIGTNDLIQYTLAVDRENTKLDFIYDAHHPAILRMIELVVKNGHKEGCRVGICGDLGADTTLTETFLKMGVDELSVPANRVLAIRKIIRETKIF